MKIRIGNKIVGPGEPIFIIVEAGVNHNGDINLAKKLIDAAKESGADCVKFQTWITEEIVTKNASKAQYQKETTGNSESQFDMIKKLELSFDDFRKLKRYCDKKGIMFMSTPDDEKSADFLYELGVPAFKMSSGELTNHRMLRKLARMNLPVILSTGMATMDQIQEAVEVFKKMRFDRYILLHCNANYPTDNKDVNLRAMDTLRKKFSNPVGYSDHTMGLEVPVAAAARGASIIEKHFTFDRKMEGPDHSASIEPDELKRMVRMIRAVEESLGSHEKFVTDSEKGNIGVMRKVIVASKDLPAGTVLTSSDFTMKRAGKGLEPKHEDYLIGKKLKISVKQDETITPDKLHSNRKSRIGFKRVMVRKHNLPASLDGFKILHMSDFHFNKDDINEKHINGLISGREFDLCVLTGDYLAANPGIKPLMDVIKNIKTRYGIYAILGNHDYRFNTKKLVEILESAGVKVLINENECLNIGKERMCIIGTDVKVHDDVDESVMNLADINRSMRGADGFKIMLSHSPDVIEEASSKGVDLLISGHTHGGQIRFPIIGPVYASSRYGTKYAYGLFKQGRTHMFVSKGIGNVKVNLFGSGIKIPFSDIRFNCKPEINMIILTR